MKKLLFTVQRKEFVIQTFKSGGPGGQHQNKTDSGVRIKHIASGAVGESRTSRSQHQNKQLAFKRLTDTKIFNSWIRRRASFLDSILIEGRTNGQWIPLNNHW